MIKRLLLRGLGVCDHEWHRADWQYGSLEMSIERCERCHEERIRGMANIPVGATGTTVNVQMEA